MRGHAEKTPINRSRAVATQTPKKKAGSKATSQFVDNRPEAVQLRKMQEMADNSPQAQHLRAMQAVADNSPQARQAAQVQAMVDNSPLMVAQRQQIDRMFGKPVQREEEVKEDDLLLKSTTAPAQPQGTYDEEPLPRKLGPVQKKENATGLPDSLKSGIENLSAVSLDDVKVHYNSARPSALQALAYTQGTDIHVGPGQEQHLPHEAWHVAQQMQGRVRATMQLGGTRVNDDVRLEKEADSMGAKASTLIQETTSSKPDVSKLGTISNNVVQGIFEEALKGIDEARFEQLVRLAEYGLDVEAQDRVIEKFAEMRDAAMKFYSIGQCVAFAFRDVMGPPIVTETNFGKRTVRESVGPEMESRLTETVHEGLTVGGRAANAENIGRDKVTLYRGDTRDFQQLTSEGGMWGRDSGAVPASHARVLVGDLVAMGETAQRDWIQAWKASTKNPLEIVPFIATGAEPQKGGYKYKIEAPLVFQESRRLSIGTDTGDLNTARVIAVRMQGGEVIFVTGIPIEFISQE